MTNRLLCCLGLIDASNPGASSANKLSDFSIALIAGVVSGLITSVVCLLVALFWKDVIRPWVEDLLYRGARIDGLWKCDVIVGDLVKKQHVSITQKGHRIEGFITS